MVQYQNSQFCFGSDDVDMFLLIIEFYLSVCVCVFQVAAQAVLFMCMNTAGIFISYLSDRAQRQAFLETRRCIEARLRLETENQRQVSPRRDAATLLITYHIDPDRN